MNVRVMHDDPSKCTVMAAPGQASGWRQHLGVLLPLLLVYLALACYRIDSQSLWADEVLSVWDAASPERFLKKTHGPLYFALLHVWMQVGTSEQILRALSLLMGAVALCLFYATSVTLVSQRVTLVGTALFATSPFLIWYSQEVRYITFMLAISLLAMYSFQRLSARGRLGWWLVYGSAVTLAIATFVTNVVLPLVQGLYLMWSSARRPLLRKWVVCQVLIGMLFMWWIGGSLLQRILVEATGGGQQIARQPTPLE